MLLIFWRVIPSGAAPVTPFRTIAIADTVPAVNLTAQQPSITLTDTLPSVTLKGS